MATRTGEQYTGHPDHPYEQARYALGMAQEEFCRRVGVSVNRYRNVVRGRGSMTADELARIESGIAALQEQRRIEEQR